MKSAAGVLMIVLRLLGISACGTSQQKSPEDGMSADTRAEEDETQSSQFDFERKTVMLNSGYEMPIIGLGTWTLNDDAAENSVYHALKSGMRLIDTARYYGNEVGVGKGIKKAIDEGIGSREEEFITRKTYGGI